jgi:hypothetical protein
MHTQRSLEEAWIREEVQRVTQRSLEEAADPQRGAVGDTKVIGRSSRACEEL